MDLLGRGCARRRPPRGPPAAPWYAWHPLLQRWLCLAAPLLVRDSGDKIPQDPTSLSSEDSEASQRDRRVVLMGPGDPWCALAGDVVPL